MIEQLQVFHNTVTVNDGVDRRVDLVLQGEYIPADFAMRVFQHASV